MKLKATIIVASLLAATAAHADTIYPKCWAQGLAGDQLNPVYINELIDRANPSPRFASSTLQCCLSMG